MPELQVMPMPDGIDEAYKGSWYTILGAGDPVGEYVVGYHGLMEDAGIGKPVAWYRTSGASINAYSGLPAGSPHAFKEDLSVLLFPLDGLNAGRLAIFKLAMEDRWMDDIVDNMRRHGGV